MVFSLEGDFEAKTFKQIMDSPKDVLQRKRRLIRKYFREVSWHRPDSRVAENILEEVVRYCV